MASNPYFSPYHTQRFSFIGSPQQRDGTYLKDQRFLNMYPELIKSDMTDGKKYYLKKRPGMAQAFQYGAAQGRGIYFWQNQFYVAVGNTLFANNTPIQTFATSTGTVGFTEYRDDTLGDLLFVCDGIQGFIIHPANNSQLITDVNFPSPHIPAPVFLDGYIFLASLNTQVIHNSTLNNPTTWPTDGFIDAEMFPDTLVWLTKSQNYLAAVGASSIEFLYDNANATGSPLQRNAPAVAQIGCPAPNTVNQTEKQIILVGNTANGGRTIWTIDGFQPTEIATEPVREALDLEGAAINLAFAFTIQCAGHKWYVLNLALGQRTFVWDFDEHMWHEWTTGPNQNVFAWNYAADTGDGTPMLLNASTGEAARLNPVVYLDDATLINCQITTSKIDFDTIKRKRFYRLSLTADSPNGASNTPMTVEWSDDDYNTWVGNRLIQINGVYPTTTQLGYAHRRAFRFTYRQPFPLRMESFELDIIQEVRR